MGGCRETHLRIAHRGFALKQITPDDKPCASAIYDPLFCLWAPVGARRTRVNSKTVRVELCFEAKTTHTGVLFARKIRIFRAGRPRSTLKATHKQSQMRRLEEGQVKYLLYTAEAPCLCSCIPGVQTFCFVGRPPWLPAPKIGELATACTLK